MAGTMSISGLVSGLKTDDIVAKVMERARAPLARLQNQKALNQQRLVAWQDINMRILGLKIKAEGIADAADFRAASATSSELTIVNATATTDATPGAYYLKVTSRAQAHQVTSQAGAFTSVNDLVGTGTVHFGLANGTSFDVTLDSSNNTLSGLRDEINKAYKGVQATIINAGTSETPDYRLLLASTQSGTGNEMSVIDTSGLSGGTSPTFNLGSPVQAAADATIELGQGAGKITVTKSTNTISDLIPGVTLNLLSADETKTVRIDVARDTSSVNKAIQDFVVQYNDLADTMRQQGNYDTETGGTPPLFGDYLLQTVHADLVSTLTNPVSGLPKGFNAIASLGITQDTTGHLQISDSQLSAALTNHMDDVAKIFGSGIESGSAYVSYLASTAETKTSTGAGWDVAITQAASRAQVTAGSQMSSPLSADETVMVNGKDVALTAGMDIDDVITSINSISDDTNVMAIKTGADGTGAGNYITFRRIQYGKDYDMTVVSNLSRSSGDTSGVGNVSVTSSSHHGEGGLGDGAEGLDVAGTINGEEATGRGQMLTLNTKGSTNAAKGLALLITATEPFSSVMVKYTKGVGASFRDLMASVTSSTGMVTQAENSLTSAMRQLDTEMADMEARFSDQEARIYSQFNAMEAQLARLQDQGNFLTAQFDAMNNWNK